MHVIARCAGRESVAPRSEEAPFSFADMIHAVGSEAFDLVFFETLQREMSVEQAIVFRADASGAMSTLMARHARDPALVAQLADAYRRRYSGRDPNHPFLAPQARREVSLITFDIGKLADRDYRDALFTRPGLVDKVSIISSGPSGNLYINFYRGAHRGAFEGADVRRFQMGFDTMAALVERHFTLIERARTTSVESLLGVFLQSVRGEGVRLSQREALVCARIVLGATSDEIADDLGVSTHTVATYRRRAFAKLDISSPTELFAIVLRHRHRLDG